jgi:hypothetical protein
MKLLSPAKPQPRFARSSRTLESKEWEIRTAEATAGIVVSDTQYDMIQDILSEGGSLTAGDGFIVVTLIVEG